MIKEVFERDKISRCMKLKDSVRRDNIGSSNEEGGIYIIMSAKKISVRLDDETEMKIDKLQQEMKEQYKIQISVTDVIRRSITELYEEMALNQDENSSE